MFTSTLPPLKNLKKELIKNDHAYYQNLFRFIQKSNLLPTIEAVQGDNPKINDLEKAIKIGDYHASCFDDKECYVHLLYLLKERRVDFWQGMTVYAYLIALMQFTNQQLLKEEDKDIKLIRPNHEFSIVNMVENSELSDEGKIYLELLKNKLITFEKSMPTRPLTHSPDQLIDRLMQTLLKMSPVDQWLLKIPFDNDKTEIDGMIQAISFTSESPHLPTQKINGNTYCLVPSFNFIHAMFTISFKDPLTFLPIFGSINENTLRELHAQGLHPISLYAPHVKTNIKKVHGLRCGPTPAFMHDLGHTLWGSILSLEERNVIFQTMIPKLEKLYNEIDNRELKDEIKSVEVALCDFDIGGLDAFNKYVKTAFSETPRAFRGSIYSIFTNNQEKPFSLIGEIIINEYEKNIHHRQVSTNEASKNFNKKV